MTGYPYLLRYRTGLVAASLAALVTASGCSSTVDVPSVQLDPSEKAACVAFLQEVPAPLVDLEEVDVSGSPPAARAFGDPALVVTCLDDVPSGYDEFAACLEVNGVGWYTPDEQVDDEDVDATFTAVGYRPIVQVQAPALYRPEVAAGVLADLSAPVTDNLREVTACR